MQLVDAMFDVFVRSKFWFRLSFLGSLLLTVLSVVSTFNLSKEIIIILAVMAFLIQLSCFIFRFFGESKYDLGEQLRRSLMLSDGLGRNLSRADWARLAQRMGNSGFSASPAGALYYESKTPAGAKRLIEILRESSFWTSGLARNSAYVFLVVSGFGMIISVISLAIVAMSLTEAKDINLIATAILPFMAFWASSDFLSFGIKFRRLQTETDRIFDRCEDLLKNPGASEIDALLVLSDYNYALAATPPIPDWIYNRQRHMLNELWSKVTGP